MSRMSWEGGLQDNDREAGRAEPAKETEDQRHRERDSESRVNPTAEKRLGSGKDGEDKGRGRRKRQW